MQTRRTLKRWWRVLTTPSQAFVDLAQRPFEKVVVEYLTLLLLVAVAAGTYIFVESMVKGLFYATFLNTDVDFARLTNYALNGVAATLTFYIFAGTFIALVLSAIFRITFRKLNYFDLLMCMMYALTPVLFFGWIVWLAPALFVWSLVLLFSGVPVLRHARHKGKGTIEERE